MTLGNLAKFSPPPLSPTQSLSRSPSMDFARWACPNKASLIWKISFKCYKAAASRRYRRGRVRGGVNSVGRRSLWRAAKTTLIKLIWYNKEKFASCQNHNDWFWIIARPAREEGGGHGNALKGHFAAICFEGNEGSATPKRKRKRKRNRFE